MPIRRTLAVLAVLGSLACGAASLAGAVTMRNFTLYSNKNEYAGYSACWSYIHADGREYAVLGTTTGTAIYNVTNLNNIYKVGFIVGPNSQWREMKSYRNWIYVVSEGTGLGQGLQIIRMTNPEAPVLAATYTTNFNRSHTVSIDTARAILICNGTNNTSTATGMRILSIAAPEAPVQLGWWPGGALPVSQANYIHDCVPMGNRLYASSIYAGIQRIFDFTAAATPTQLVQWTYAGAFSHNCWPDTSKKVLFVTDEVNGERLKVFDIATETSPVLTNAITSNPLAIVHNAHVRGQELFLSNYTEGIRICDIVDPLHPAEFAWADSWAGTSGGFSGVWEVCPYFPSGTVIASDIQSGLYVYRPTRAYGVIRAKVVDAVTQQPIAGATLRLTPQGDSLTTSADGIQQFAPNPGLYTVRATKFGYDSDAALVNILQGARDTVVLSLTAKNAVALAGSVHDGLSFAPLEDAEVKLVGTPLEHEHTDAAGDYDYGTVPQDGYLVSVKRPGYASIVSTQQMDPGMGALDFTLFPAALWDSLELNTGWTVGAGGDAATTGIWTRVEPFGTHNGPEPAVPAPRRREGAGTAARSFLPPGRDLAGTLHEGHESDGATPGEVQPEHDRTPGTGTVCYVTGQGTDPINIGEQDVDGGRTSLITRVLDCTGMARPTLGVWRWFYKTGDEFDWLATYISNDNGANWVPVDTVRDNTVEWVEKDIKVSSFVTPTSTVKLKFVAADLGAGSVVEAGIDDLVLYDASANAAGVPPPRQVRGLAFLGLRPNPFTRDAGIALQVPHAGRLRIEILDTQGRRVRTLFDGAASEGRLDLKWDGRTDEGRESATGVYYAYARMDASRTSVRLVRMR